MHRSFFSFLFLILMSILLIGCRGNRTPEPPIHLNPNFDWQSKFRAQRLSLNPPDATVPYGDKFSFNNPKAREQYLKQDSEFYTGKNQNGQAIKDFPVKLTPELLKRGQERYNIYCAVCHDQYGTGKGLVASRGFVMPPNFHDQRILDYANGEFFNVITNGIRSMPGYARQIPESDRWAIIAYIRALQKTRKFNVKQIPENQLSEIKN